MHTCRQVHGRQGGGGDEGSSKDAHGVRTLPLTLVSVKSLLPTSLANLGLQLTHCVL